MHSSTVLPVPAVGYLPIIESSGGPPEEGAEGNENEQGNEKEQGNRRAGTASGTLAIVAARDGVCSTTPGTPSDVDAVFLVRPKVLALHFHPIHDVYVAWCCNCRDLP